MGSVEPFAQYLGKLFIAKKDYREGAVKEAEDLFHPADFVLTRLDGMTMHMICLVDGETHPGKIFSYAKDQVMAITKACQSYTGTLQDEPIPVEILVLEIHPHPITDEARARLRALAELRRGQGAYIIPGAIDAASRQVEMFAPLGAMFQQKLFIEKALREPRLAADALTLPKPQVFAPEGKPVLTCTVMMVLGLMFLAVHLLPGEGQGGLFSPGTKPLLLMGALNKELVSEYHEWFRLFTAPLLHGDMIHLALNSFVLLMGGRMLENWVGRRWTLCIYMLSACGGSLVSLLLMGKAAVGVGASGAIMGVFAAAFLISRRLPYENGRSTVQRNLLGVLIPALLPIAIGGFKIDVGAHLGGMLTGAAVAALLLKLWRRDAPRPQLAELAGLVGAALVLLTIYAEWLNLSLLMIPA